jgi:DNA-binding NarL/FixJ family response regulator
MQTKIMIIDAHPVYVLKTVGFLESLTLKDNVVVARGQKAIEAVGEHKPDVIVLSATLSDADSVELSRQIKSLYPAVAMIIQTGLLTSAQVEGAFKSVGVDYVVPRLEKDWSAFQHALTDILSARST